jgi:hypothetical protein
LVLRYLKDFEMDVLEIACECKCENFVSNIIVQNILNDIWFHKKETENKKEKEDSSKVPTNYLNV